MIEYLTVKKAAELLGVTGNFLYKEIRMKRLPHIKLGEKIIRISQPDLEMYIASHKH